VTDSGIQLVDLDGMFVPSLRGYQASEIGHPHFQPPWRTSTQFDETIDRFPALVIYLSLVALSKLPHLWNRYHDENLIFTNHDFRDPIRSSLFRELRAADRETASLTKSLADACLQPSKVPRLSSLVRTPASKLPEWMRQEQIVHVETITRESKAQPMSAGPSATSASGTPWWAGASSPQPTSTAIPGTPTSKYGFLTLRVALSEGRKAALSYAAWGLLCFWLWVPLLHWLSAGAGIQSSSVIVLLYVWFCACAGLGTVIARGRKVAASQGATATSAYAGSSSSSYGTAARPSYSGSWSPYSNRNVASQSGASSPPPAQQPSPAPARQTYTASPSSTTTILVVGSKVSVNMIYHRPSCPWAQKISGRNRVGFGSAAAARAQGYRPCRVCGPY
jgi:hypothetical protein